MDNNVKKLATHNGSFHADDVFATATLALILEVKGEKFEVIRTRDEDILKSADFVYDVGGIYDESKNRFDHHQTGGAGRDELGIEYSSFGLVWKKFGAELCGSEKAANMVRSKLVASIDGPDNGQDIVTSIFENVFPYTIQSYFFSMQPTWREDDSKIDEIFMQAVEFGKKILQREIVIAKDLDFAESQIKEIYNNSENKKILVFNEHYPMDQVLYKLPEPLFILYPRPDGNWGIRAVRKQRNSFENRKNFPASWGGLRDEELQKVTSIPDAIFCHRALFLCVAKTKEGALALADLAIKS